MMYATFRQALFAGFLTVPGSTVPPAAPAPEVRLVALSPDQELRVRAIYRSGFEATAVPAGAAVEVRPTGQRRRVLVRVRVRDEEGGGMRTLPNLHEAPPAAAGELVATEIEDLTQGRVVLTPAQAEVRAMQAVRELLEVHPAPSREHLLETFGGLWGTAHVDMREALAEGLHSGLVKLGERSVTKLVEKAVRQATQDRADFKAAA